MMRIERVVVNASPLIALFRSGLQGLLPALFTDIVVPETVWQEVVAGGHDDVAARELSRTAWIKRVPIAAVDPLVLAWDLGPGESAVLSFARSNPDYRAMVDDAAARRCARVLSIRTLGTGGLLVLAKRRGVIPSVADALTELRKAGLWLSDSLVSLLLEQAGERLS